MFAGGLDFSLPVRKFFYDPLGSGKAFVDCVVSLTGFALVGGPARQDAPKVQCLPPLNLGLPDLMHDSAQMKQIKLEVLAKLVSEGVSNIALCLHRRWRR